ncbi:MAG: hypothetical protein WA584_07810 [Pyrinomonadaceae bacterium]
MRARRVTDALTAGDDLDALSVAYCRIFPETVFYKGELSDV